MQGSCGSKTGHTRIDWSEEQFSSFPSAEKDVSESPREGGWGGGEGGALKAAAPTTGSTAPQASRNFEVRISPFAPRTSARDAKAGSSMLISASR